MLAHSLLGCAVYGGLAAKVTIVRLHRFPRFTLPIAGGLLFASGQVGPNLDSIRPNYSTVLARVTSGGGVMPSFAKTLTPGQIRDVAAFVAERAGG